VTPLATTTATATVTLAGGNEPDPIDASFRIVTATVTMTEAIPVEYTLTDQVTMTVSQSAVIPVPITTTRLSTITSSSTVQQSTQTVNNGQGAQEASQAQETSIPFDYTCRAGDANEKYPGGMSLEATDNQRVTLCKLRLITFHTLSSLLTRASFYIQI
jgi:hypothetical protein